MANRDGKKLKPFNPLDKRSLGELVCRKLLDQPLLPLSLGRFIGAGIYVIYYRGAHPLYRPLIDYEKRSGRLWPIYVGKAIPKGARKGGVGLDSPHGTDLCRRIGDHRKSVEQADNLSLDDFQCRYLVVDDIWIPLAEQLLITSFHPAWNKLIDGFGNHDPGKGRREQLNSEWDTIHPGRRWADKQRERENFSLEDTLKSYREKIAETMRRAADQNIFLG